MVTQAVQVVAYALIFSGGLVPYHLACPVTPIDNGA